MSEIPASYQFRFHGSYILTSRVEVAAMKFALMQGPFNLIQGTLFLKAGDSLEP
jgi:hypothetical protein